MTMTKHEVVRLLHQRLDYYFRRPKEAGISQKIGFRGGSGVSAERVCLEWYAVELIKSAIAQEMALVFGTKQRVRLNLVVWRPRQNGIYHGVHAYADLTFNVSKKQLTWHAKLFFSGKGVLDFECWKQVSRTVSRSGRQTVFRSRAYIRPHMTSYLGFISVDHYHLRPGALKRY